MLQSLASRPGITPDKHLYNGDRFGNFGVAKKSALNVLSQQ